MYCKSKENNCIFLFDILSIYMSNLGSMYNECYDMCFMMCLYFIRLKQLMVSAKVFTSQSWCSFAYVRKQNFAMFLSIKLVYFCCVRKISVLFYNLNVNIICFVACFMSNIELYAYVKVEDCQNYRNSLCVLNNYYPLNILRTKIS